MAMFTCPERVVRNGVLIAFKGEKMSETEAKRRGIYDEVAAPAETEQAAEETAKGKPEAAPAETEQAADFDDMTIDEIKAYIDERGGEYMSKAKKADLIEIAEGL